MNGDDLGLVMNSPTIWNQIIAESFHELFDISYLKDMGSVYAREFSGQTLCDREGVPSIPLSVCRFEQARMFCGEKSGFDLPSLVTPKLGWNGKIVAFAAQDPLRKGDWCADALTMSTPWGFSFPPNWSANGNTKVWHSVKWLCSQGYGAYFTDVSKLYLARDAQRVSGATRDLEADVFQSEVRAVDPVLWVAFGNKALTGLEYLLPQSQHNKIDRHPHPKAYGALKRAYKTPGESHEEIKEAVRLQIAQKLTML